jgi:hypothetical protein
MVRPAFRAALKSILRSLEWAPTPSATRPLPGSEALSPPAGGPASGPGMRTGRYGQLGGHGLGRQTPTLASCLSPMPGSSHAVLRNPVSTPASGYATALMAHRLTQPAQLSNAHSVAPVHRTDRSGVIRFGLHIQCRSEGVQFVRRTKIMDALASFLSHPPVGIDRPDRLRLIPPRLPLTWSFP